VKIRTPRLDLVACPQAIARAVTNDRTEAEQRLGARLPADWPASELRGFLARYADQLAADPLLLGWGIWLMIDRTAGSVVGDLGFKGRPRQGTVEIGYSVLPAGRNKGLASEATRALVDWALAQPEVRRIIAHCDEDNAPSIRVLEKLGMERRGRAGGQMRWERRRPDGDDRESVR
jgi:ribosomal-protein-alanine N-acetyltransferase